MQTTQLERIEVPAREGRALRVAAGRAFRVIDVAGGQVGDLFAFAGPGEYLSASHTRARTRRLFPRVGDAFDSNRRRPLLQLVADDSPGVHDMLIAACDPERYVELGVDGPHASCAENLLRAFPAAQFVPQPVNLFMRIPVTRDELEFLPAPTAPGDSVTLRALVELDVVLSACPQDVLRINGGQPTALEIELL